MDARHVASGFDSSAPVVFCFDEAWLLLGKGHSQPERNLDAWAHSLERDSRATRGEQWLITQRVGFKRLREGGLSISFSLISPSWFTPALSKRFALKPRT